MDLATIQLLFRFNDWARDRLMSFVEPLTAKQLDQPFEMGLGSLRETVDHLYSVEWVWLERWKGRSPAANELPTDCTSMKKLWSQWRETASERNSFVQTLTGHDLDRLVTYTNVKGKQGTFKLGHMLIHVCNHGTHHRAQAINMLRHVGVSPPEMDFLWMFKE